MRVKLVVAYDGTNYCGWQLQNNGLTIEAVLNRTLSALCGEEIQVIGASRTDSGVHAYGNVAVFDTNTRIPAEKISYALNQRLPADIRVQESRQVAEDFHPRHCVSRKTYEYRILNSSFEQPIGRQYVHFIHRPLNASLMQEAGTYFLGEHDFKSFCSAGSNVKDTVRTIYGLTVEKEASYITIRVCGSGFLYNMVRIIAGTLIEIGFGTYPPAHIRDIIEAENRAAAGPTAPACGLSLINIEYAAD